jgi:uncharacterized protein
VDENPGRTSDGDAATAVERAADGDDWSAAAAHPAEHPAAPQPASAAPDQSPATPTLQPGRFYRLDPRVIRLDRIGGWIFTACVSIPGFFASPILLYPVRKPLVALLVFIAWLIVTAALAWLAHYWPPIDYRYTFYKIDPEALEIRRGVVWRRVITVPRSRVQHIDVSQGPLERSHGLASLSIYTAGTEHAQVTLKGVAHNTAVAIRDQFLPGVQEDGV